MEGFQIKFLLLQKAMTPCQIKRKRKKACRFFFFSVSGQNSSQKAHSAASAVLHLYYIKIWLILKQTACPVMHCRKQLPYCTVATYTKSVTIIWPCGSLTTEKLQDERRERKQKNHCAFLTVLSLSFRGAKEIFLLFLEEICQIFLDLNPLAIATVRLEFWGLVALLVGNCRQTSIN